VGPPNVNSWEQILEIVREKVPPEDFRRWFGAATKGVVSGGRGVCDGRAKGSARLRCDD